MAVYMLCRPSDHQPIAYLRDDDVEFLGTGKRMEAILSKSGIVVPEKLREQFDGRKIIYFEKNSTIFAKAFREIYFPRSLRKSAFTLEEQSAGD